MTHYVFGVLAGLVSGLLLWVAPYLPLVMGVPVALVWARSGYRTAVLTVLVALVCSGLMAGLPGALLFLIAGGIPGCLLGISWREQAPPAVAILRTSTSFLALILIAMIFGEAIGLQVQPFGAEQFASLEAALVESGLYSEEMALLLSTFQETMQFAAPAVMAVVATVNGFGATLLGSWVGPKLGVPVRPLPPFRTWRLPRWLFWVYLPLWLMMGDDLVGRIMYNLFFLLNLGFIVQGLAVLYAFVVRRLGRFISAGLSALLFLSPLTQFLAFVGILDGALNFRARLQNGDRR